MINVNFNKKCNIEKLSEELKLAGFDIYGCSGVLEPALTIVHLKDTEIKDCSTVVNAHVYTKPEFKIVKEVKLLDKLLDKGIISQQDYNDIVTKVQAVA